MHKTFISESFDAMSYVTGIFNTQGGTFGLGEVIGKFSLFSVG